MTSSWARCPSPIVYLVLKGELPGEAHGKLMDAILIASVDHGASPPSVLAARTVASTGTPLSTAIAAGILSISRYHGGAIEDCMRLMLELVKHKHEKSVDATTAAREKYGPRKSAYPATAIASTPMTPVPTSSSLWPRSWVSPANMWEWPTPCARR